MSGSFHRADLHIKLTLSSCILVGGLYGENTPPTELADRIAESNPKHVVKLLHQRIIPKLADADKDMLSGLSKAGFQTTAGPDGSGFIMMALERAGGYYFNTGGSDRIINGAIKVKAGEITEFSGEKVIFKDGSTDQFDVVGKLLLFMLGSAKVPMAYIYIVP